MKKVGQWKIKLDTKKKVKISKHVKVDKKKAK